MRSLAIVIAFAIGLVSGMTLELPAIQDSQIVDQQLEIRRRIG